MGRKDERVRAARAIGVALGLALAACGSAAYARDLARDATVAPTMGDYSVTLEQCVGSSAQAERSATFVAQMDATQATQKMSVRIDLEQRLRGEAEFHKVLAPGLGLWRAAEPGVKIYKYVKQITNLKAPAVYRALVHFRWIGDKARMIKHAEARSGRCLQSAQASSPVPAPTA